MANNHNGQQLPQLASKTSNFSNWRFHVECLLDEKAVKDLVMKEIDITNLTGEPLKEFQRRDAKAKSLIVQCLSDQYIEYVKDAKSSYEMMKCLSNIFQRKSTLSKLYYRRKLLTLKCGEDTDLQDHFLIFDGLVRDLEGTGSVLDEDDKVCHLLLTMSEKYHVVITVLETTTAELTLELVKSRLLDMELKMKNEKDEKKERNPEECSFSANRGQNFSRKCYICNSENHLAYSCPKRSPSNSRGNYKGRGRFRGVRRRLENNQNASSANVAERIIEGEIGFVALTTYTDESNEKHINFIIDSGATNNLISPKFEKYVTDIKDMYS